VQGELLLLFALHLALTGLPLAAASLGAARLGVRQVPVLLAIGLLVSATVGLLGFWTYYGSRTLGQTFSCFVLMGSVLLIALSLHGGRLGRPLLRQLAIPLGLWALGSVFLVYLGFLHGGLDNPIGTAMSRFAGGLPADNDIPKYFAEWFYLHGHGERPPEFPGEWLSSDRPPLQVGYVLSQRPFGWDEHALTYQVLGVMLQQLWIVGLWALLLAAKVGRVTRALTMATVLVSGLAILNGFFVWPKMLPAALLLAAAAMVLTPLWDDLRRTLWGAGLVAGLCALAMLAHGGTVFGVIALAAVAAYRGMPSWRWIGVAAAVGVVLMAPWSAYQKWGDPPGNRLNKWTLAGVVEVDDRGTLEAIGDAYGEVGLGGALHNKGQNLVTMVGGGPMVETIETGLESDELRDWVATARLVIFFNLFPSLGLLLLAPLAMFAARRRGPPQAEWSFALVCFAALAVGIVGWALLVFGSEAMRTVLHAGTYLLPILAMAGAVAGLRASFPRFALWWVGAWALISLALYVPALDPPPGTSYSLLAALLVALSLGGFGALSLLGSRD
jgi:hypothetical protein